MLPNCTQKIILHPQYAHPFYDMGCNLMPSPRCKTDSVYVNKINTSFSQLGVFNLWQRQHFEISYSRYANKHFNTGVYITIND